MDDEYMRANYSKLFEILETLDIFDNSAKTTNITEDFLTIINFTDYHLYEIDEGNTSSNFILRRSCVNTLIRLSCKFLSLVLVIFLISTISIFILLPTKNNKKRHCFVLFKV